ncbi:hypothetical protein BT67DRAFT_52856 [Trichocladium antarcticum]|uniref:Uncharacterized protein n=1 Tax=Trichocladium antarcticum TaxID=1450529 RepID=A0AAN6ZD60_9PEZI|nr:hypothetical protein BT67DRAFT_52856 [Trichocladium antarcticum]
MCMAQCLMRNAGQRYVCSGRGCQPKARRTPEGLRQLVAVTQRTTRLSVHSRQDGRPTLAHGHAHAHAHESGVAGVSGVGVAFGGQGRGCVLRSTEESSCPKSHTPSLPLLQPTPPITSNGPNPANLLVTRSCSWLTPVRQKQVQRWGRYSCPNSVTSPVQVGRAAILRREDRRVQELSLIARAGADLEPPPAACSRLASSTTFLALLAGRAVNSHHCAASLGKGTHPKRSMRRPGYRLGLG